MISEARLAQLDVVNVSTIEHDDGTYTFRYALRDGRRLDRSIAAGLIERLMYERDLAKTISTWLHEELMKAYRRCMDHEDCAGHRSLGEACWTATYGHLFSSGVAIRALHEPVLRHGTDNG